jgi:hypothetical protein
MGQGPLTGGNCSFPYAGEPDCNQTCGDFLGPEYHALRIVGIVMASLGSILYIVQMVTVARNYMEHRKHHKHLTSNLALRRVLEFRLFVGIGIACFLLQ